MNSMLLVKSARRFAVIYYAERVISKLTRRYVQFPRLWSNLDGALFCFCVNRTAKTYFEHLFQGGGTNHSGIETTRGSAGLLVYERLLLTQYI